MKYQYRVVRGRYVFMRCSFCAASAAVRADMEQARQFRALGWSRSLATGFVCHREACRRQMALANRPTEKD